MSVTAQQALAVYSQADVLYTEHEVEAAIERMAQEITAQFKDSNPLVLCVMTGAVVIAGKLLTRLDFPLQLDYLHATRYCGQTRGGELHWLVKPVTSLQDRVVLIIDDILDEGYTLQAIIAECKALGAREVHCAVLVHKLHGRTQDVTARFVGLAVADRYVFGYGMDYQGYLRNAPGIYAVKETDNV